MEEKLATELLHEIKAQSKRWFIAFLVVLVLWFSTIGIFIWYVSLPTEVEELVNVENEDGLTSYVGSDMSGDINYGKDSG